MNTLNTLVCTLVASVAIAPCASAATFNFSAAQVSDSIFEGGVANSIVDEALAFSNLSGTITIDEASQSSAGVGPNVSNFDFPTISLDQFDVSGQFSTTSSALRVENDGPAFPLGTVDSIRTTPDTQVRTAGIYQTWSFFLEDNTASILGSADLPSIIDAADWDEGSLVFNAFEIGSSGDIIASETVRFAFETVAAVPVPASLPLTVAGFALLWGASRRQRGKVRFAQI